MLSDRTILNCSKQKLWTQRFCSESESAAFDDRAIIAVSVRPFPWPLKGLEMAWRAMAKATWRSRVTVGSGVCENLDEKCDVLFQANDEFKPVHRLNFSVCLCLASSVLVNPVCLCVVTSVYRSSCLPVCCLSACPSSICLSLVPAHNKMKGINCHCSWTKLQRTRF